MPVNGVPSDEWKVSQALGPYAKKPDEDELEAMERALREKKNFISCDREGSDFEMPF